VTGDDGRAWRIGILLSMCMRMDDDEPCDYDLFGLGSEVCS